MTTPPICDLIDYQLLEDEAKLFNIINYLMSFLHTPRVIANIQKSTFLQSAVIDILRTYFELLHYSVEQIINLTNIVKFIFFTNNGDNMQLLEHIPNLDSIQINKIVFDINSLFQYFSTIFNKEQNAANKIKKNVAYFYCLYHQTLEK